MNKLIVAMVLAGFATIAVNAAADPIVRVVNGNTVIILDPIVVIARPKCSAPRPLAQGSGTVRVCVQGAL